jgi:hypothetical protein
MIALSLQEAAVLKVLAKRLNLTKEMRNEASEKVNGFTQDARVIGRLLLAGNDSSAHTGHFQAAFELSERFARDKEGD